MYKKLMTCLESVKKKIDFKPEVALILGSGLGDFADGIQIEQTINYAEIEGFPVSTVKGHKGRFAFVRRIFFAPSIPIRRVGRTTSDIVYPS